MADALDQFRLAAIEQRGKDSSALFTVAASQFHLDQFVMRQGEIKLAQHAIGETFLAHQDDRVEGVGEAAQITDLGLGKRHRREAVGRVGRVGQVIMRAMARSKSSQVWLKEHFNDPYVKRAQAEGWRSRAVYKLEELLERDRLLKPGMTIIDLGAAPGSWSQMARQRLGDGGRVIALDILPMDSIAGVDFICGDFREEEALKRLEAELGGQQVDLVLSDMAPNMSGVGEIDQIRVMDLADLADDFARQHLKPGGAFLIKLFQGGGFDAYVKRLRANYGKVSVRKPKASRPRSPEVYALAIEKRR